MVEEILLAFCRDSMAESVEEMTPLKQKLDDFGRFLSKVLHPLLKGFLQAFWKRCLQPVIAKL